MYLKKVILSADLRDKSRARTVRFFSKEEWVTQCTNGKLCLEDGVMCDPEEFWRYRQGSVWDDGWEIIPNPERSVG